MDLGGPSLNSSIMACLYKMLNTDTCLSFFFLQATRHRTVSLSERMEASLIYSNTEALTDRISPSLLFKFKIKFCVPPQPIKYLLNLSNLTFSMNDRFMALADALPSKQMRLFPFSTRFLSSLTSNTPS